MDPMLESVWATLQATQHVDAATRRAAEHQLATLQQQPGCALSLVRVALEPTIGGAMRQLAAVLLKQHVRVHWSTAAEGHFPPGK